MKPAHSVGTGEGWGQWLAANVRAVTGGEVVEWVKPRINGLLQQRCWMMRDEASIEALLADPG